MRPKKSVEEMQGYFVPMYENDWDIKIDSNENNYGASPRVYEAIKDCNIKNISFYPFYGELSQKIADFYGFSINNIKVTNGADEAIQGIIQTYLEKDETLLTLDVSFEMPVIYAQIQGGKIKKVPFNEKWIFLEELCDISPDELTNLPGKKKMPFFIALESPDNIFFKFFQSADLTLRDKAGNSLLFPALVHDLLNGSLNRFEFLCNKGLNPDEKNLAGFSCNDMLQHYTCKI